MIDFVKMNISYLSERDLLNNPLISCKQTIDINTGELQYPIKGTYFDLDVKINPKRKELSGSLHKHTNTLKTAESQNYNELKLSELFDTINQIEKVFSLDPTNTIIENLEIGININTDESPKYILNDKLIVWNDKSPTSNKDYKGTGKLYDFQTSQNKFKIYDKGKQYKRSENILRIECHIERNEKLSQYGIRTLSDLKNIENLKRLYVFLIDSFDLCLIVDNLESESFNDPKEKEIFLKGINPKTWQTFKGMQKKRFKDRFYSLLEKNKLNTTKKQLKEKLQLKIDSVFKCYEMNDFEKSICYEMNDFDKSENSIKNGNMLRYEPYIYIHNVTSKKCKITGIDISHQKTESKFLSKSSIYQIYKSDNNLFNDLLKRFSPKSPELMTIEKQCLEIAHNIRNTDSNKRHEIKRKTKLYANSLFPLT